MAYDQLIAMNVTDEAGYARYRAAMTPLLHEFGGTFRYDFRIAETLQSETDHPITRVFILSFPDASRREAFFADERYLDIRRRHFDGAVGEFTRIGGVTAP